MSSPWPRAGRSCQRIPRSVEVVVLAENQANSKNQGRGVGLKYISLSSLSPHRHLHANELNILARPYQLPKLRYRHKQTHTHTPSSTHTNTNTRRAPTFITGSNSTVSNLHSKFSFAPLHIFPSPTSALTLIPNPSHTSARAPTPLQLQCGRPTLKRCGVKELNGENSSKNVFVVVASLRY